MEPGVLWVAEPAEGEGNTPGAHETAAQGAASRRRFDWRGCDRVIPSVTSAGSHLIWRRNVAAFRRLWGLGRPASAAARAGRAMDRRQSLRNAVTSGGVVIILLLAPGSRWNAISVELGIREIPLQIHPSKIMQQMQGTSFAGLARTAQKPDIPLMLRGS